MDWKQSFNPTVLKEGYTLYLNQCCGPIQVHGPFYQGMIVDPSKSHSYLVQSKLENHEVEFIHCSCPLGQGENLCPHEAAFLFALEKQLPLFESTPSAQKKPFASFGSGDSWASFWNKDSNFSSIPPKSSHPLKQEQRENFSNFLSPQERKEARSAMNHLLKEESMTNHSWPSFFKEKENQTQEVFPPISKNSSVNLSSQELEDFYQGLAHLTGKTYPDPKQVSSFSHFGKEPSKSLSSLKNREEKKDSSLESRDKEKDKVLDSVASGRFEQESNDFERSKPKMGLQGLIASLSRNELETFVLKEALNHLDFRLRLELQLLQEVPEDLLDMYCSWLDKVVYEAKRDSQETFKRIHPYFKEKVELLLEHQHFAMAFSFISYAISIFQQAHLVLDQEMATDLLSWLSIILSQAKSSLESEIFAWLEIEFEKNSLDSQWHQILFTLLGSFFVQDQYKTSKVERLKADFLVYEAQPTKEAHQNLEKVIESLESLYEHNPDLSQKDLAFKERLESQPYFWYLQMDKAYTNKNYQRARMICQRLIRMYPRDSFLQAQYIRHLISLWSLEGKEEQALQTLIDFISHSSHVQPDDLIKLSQKVDEETYMGALVTLKNKVSPFILAEAYFEKNKEEELMAWIEESHDLLLAIQYEKFLKEKYASRLAALWKEEALQKANTKNVANYKEVAWALEKIAVLPGQHQVAQDLAKSIHETYPNKHALFHRLQETGLLKEGE